MISSPKFRLYIFASIVLGGFLLLLQRLWTLQIDRQEEYIKALPSSGEKRHILTGVRGGIFDRNGVAMARNRMTLEVVINLADIEAYWKELHHEEILKKKTKDGKPFVVPTMEMSESPEPVTDIIAVLNEVLFPRLDALGLYNPPDAAEIQKIRKHFVQNKGILPYIYKPIPGDMRRTRLEMGSETDVERFIAFEENLATLPGVQVRERSTREYPLRALGGHYLGYVRLDLPPGAKDEIKSDQAAGRRTYMEVEDLGVEGLEKSLDPELRAKRGVRVVRVDEHGKDAEEIPEKYAEPVPGSDFNLTIDARIQLIAERAMREAQPIPVGRGGAVVMDPNTGEILALASVPSFDPNKFVPFIVSENWKKFNDYDQDFDPSGLLLNRAINSYAPGSTFKIITALAASTRGFGGKPYNCPGEIPFGNRMFPCWTKQKGIGGHGTLLLQEAVKRSCNCFFYRMGNDADIDTIAKIAGLFHIGQPSGLQIDGNTPSLGRHGFMPTEDWWKTAPGGGLWSNAKTANVSIGQGEVLATPLQMCTVACTVANGGKVFNPRLLKRQTRYEIVNGRKLEHTVEFPPSLQADLVEGKPEELFQKLQLGKVRKRDMASLKEGMIQVVNAESGGTARRAKSPYKIAGKTGTAQMKRTLYEWLPRLKEGKPELVDGKPVMQWQPGGEVVKDNHTWFIAFAPYDDPKIAVAVVVANGEAGGLVAAPIARRIIEQSLAMWENKLTVRPEPLEPAQGHFRKLDQVTFPDLVFDPADTGTEDADTVEDDEPAAEVQPVKPVAATPVRKAIPVAEDEEESKPNIETGSETAPAAGVRTSIQKKSFQENKRRNPAPPN